MPKKVTACTLDDKFGTSFYHGYGAMFQTLMILTTLYSS